MRIGSLFSGIGGIELGFEKQGFKTLWFIENDLYAREIIRKRFPKADIYDDVTQIDFKTIPKIDILTGGFPCQDISNAGKRAGIEGRRSSLWKYYLEAIRILRPRYALIENVSALLNRGFDVILADLAEVGYDAEWHCVPASAVGALHRRDRIFILAYPQLCGYIHRQIKEQSTERGKQAFRDIGSTGFDVPDTDSIRRNNRWHNREKRQLYPIKEREIKEIQQERNRWKHWIRQDGEIFSDTDNGGLDGTSEEGWNINDVIWQSDHGWW